MVLRKILLVFVGSLTESAEGAIFDYGMDGQKTGMNAQQLSDMMHSKRLSHMMFPVGNGQFLDAQPMMRQTQGGQFLDSQAMMAQETQPMGQVIQMPGIMSLDIHMQQHSMQEAMAMQEHGMQEAMAMQEQGMQQVLTLPMSMQHLQVANDGLLQDSEQGVQQEGNQEPEQSTYSSDAVPNSTPPHSSGGSSGVVPCNDGSPNDATPPPTDAVRVGSTLTSSMIPSLDAEVIGAERMITEATDAAFHSATTAPDTEPRGAVTSPHSIPVDAVPNVNGAATSPDSSGPSDLRKTFATMAGRDDVSDGSTPKSITYQSTSTHPACEKTTGSARSTTGLDPTMKTITIFDWDDTFLMTTHLKNIGYIDVFDEIVRNPWETVTREKKDKVGNPVNHTTKTDAKDDPPETETVWLHDDERILKTRSGKKFTVSDRKVRSLLSQVETLAIDMLKKALSIGDVHIVTNATLSWLRYTAVTLLPRLADFIFSNSNRLLNEMLNNSTATNSTSPANSDTLVRATRSMVSPSGGTVMKGGVAVVKPNDPSGNSYYPHEGIHLVSAKAKYGWCKRDQWKNKAFEEIYKKWVELNYDYNVDDENFGCSADYDADMIGGKESGYSADDDADMDGGGECEADHNINDTDRVEQEYDREYDSGREEREKRDKPRNGAEASYTPNANQSYAGIAEGDLAGIPYVPGNAKFSADADVGRVSVMSGENRDTIEDTIEPNSPDIEVNQSSGKGVSVSFLSRLREKKSFKANSFDATNSRSSDGLVSGYYSTPGSTASIPDSIAGLSNAGSDSGIPGSEDSSSSDSSILARRPDICYLNLVSVGDGEFEKKAMLFMKDSFCDFFEKHSFKKYNKKHSNQQSSGHRFPEHSSQLIVAPQRPCPVVTVYCKTVKLNDKPCGIQLVKQLEKVNKSFQTILEKKSCQNISLEIVQTQKQSESTKISL